MTSLDALFEEFANQKPDPWYKAVYWAVYRFFKYGARSRFYNLKAAYQRGRYGWAEWDMPCAGFDGTMMPALGKSLVHFSENLHGAPHGYGGEGKTEVLHGVEHPVTNFQKWEDDCRRHGQALIDYNEYDKTHEYDRETMVANHAKATEALHFVADHFSSLWD